MNRAARTTKVFSAAGLLLLAGMLLAACGNGGANGNGGNASSGQAGISDPAVASGNAGNANNADGSGNGGSATGGGITDPGTETGDGSGTNAGTNAGASDNDAGSIPASQNQSPQPDMAAETDPESIDVLVNKQFALPDNYEPTDLVYPDVPFTFTEKIEKRKMRKEAAAALEDLFAGAKKDGIYLAGVSAYRSYDRQKAVFESYVAKDGEEKAKTYSAVPGHSEHETGLAIDVSGSDGKCAAEDCFGDTKEAAWIAKHVQEYGFILRYPEGKEDITGYKYEPWHIRYVGKDVAKEIYDRGITLEEYYNAVPVSK